MIGEKYIGRMDQLLQRNRLLGFALAVMLIFNFWNWAALAKAKAQDRVLVVPVVGGTGMWVGDGKASDQYLRAMARYITAMLGNYQAGTYRSQLEELLLLFPADVVGQVHGEFMKLADEVDRYPSISSYVQFAGDHPLKTMDNLIQVAVLKRRLVNGSVTETTNSFYCINYRIADTQFELTSVEELTGAGEDLCINKVKNTDAAAAKGEAPAAKAAPAPAVAAPAPQKGV